MSLRTRRAIDMARRVLSWVDSDLLIWIIGTHDISPSATFQGLTGTPIDVW